MPRFNQSPSCQRDEPDRSDEFTFIPIGSHVVNANDPNAALLQGLYNRYSTDWQYCPFGLCSEYKIWGQVCMDLAARGICSRDFMEALELGQFWDLSGYPDCRRSRNSPV